MSDPLTYRITLPAIKSVYELLVFLKSGCYTTSIPFAGIFLYTPSWSTLSFSSNASAVHAASSDRPVISKHVSNQRGKKKFKKNTRTLWFIKPQKRQHGRRNIAQRALLLVLLPVLVVRKRKRGGGALGPREDERDFVRRVRGVRRARLGVLHLLRVAVVCGHEQRVAGLLARSVDRADRRVRVHDRLDGGVEDARMPDLCVFVHK